MIKKQYLLIAVTALVTSFLFVPRASAQEFSDWSTPVNLGPIINAASSDMRPAISKDGLSLYFESDRPGGCGGFDIYVSQRASFDSPWEAPVNLDRDRLQQGLPCLINSSAQDSAPNLTVDGHTLFFHSYRATDNCGVIPGRADVGGDIFYAHRKNRRDDFGWEAPRNLNRYGRDPEEPLRCGELGSTLLVNTPNTDGGPAFFADDATDNTILYFTRSDQPTNVGDFDIYFATLGMDGTWGTIVRDNELSTTPFRDTRTAIRRRDGLEMIFSSERPSGLGSRDIWMSTRASTLDLWSVPVMVPNINSTSLDGAPAISWDGTELYFNSSRAGVAAGNDLYVSTRTKITGHQP